MSPLHSFCLMGLAAASVAHASPAVPDRPEPELSSRLRPKWVDAHYDVRRTLDDLARCSVTSAPDRSVEMILRADGELTEADRKLVTPDCLVFATWSVDFGPVLLQTSQASIQFTFADAIFRRALVNSDPARLIAAPPIAQPRYLSAQFQLGECVVRKAPANAKALLLTKVETPAETRAFTALVPTITDCAARSSSGAPDKADVRGAIAFNYVRLAAATGQLRTQTRGAR